MMNGAINGLSDHAQIHRLHTKTVKVARELGLGRRNPRGEGFLFSRNEERQAREEIERRKTERKACITSAPEYDRKRQRESAARWRDDWRREVLVEMKSIELALLELSRRVHALSAAILADVAAPWNRGRRDA